jgi:hypothetical protein
MTIAKSNSAERVEQQGPKSADKRVEKPRPAKMSLEDLGAAILARTQELESRLVPQRLDADG